MSIDLSDHLETWGAVAQRVRPTALLIGNGASSSIWPDFAYRSLYEKSKPFLQPPDRALFARFGSTNFEVVLRALATSATVLEELGLDHAEIDRRYASVHKALIEVVHAVHVPWTESLLDSCLRPMRTHLASYESIFSTNYDLLLYWAMISDGRLGLADFIDFFWSGWPPRFDRFDLAVKPDRTNATRVYFLHGGLHLYRDASNRTAKLVADSGPLLDQFATTVLPEYVAEGTWAQKAATIASSDYLSFALASFARLRGPVAIFGHALDPDGDGHLLKAMRGWGERSVAVSVHAGSRRPSEVKRDYLRVLPPDLNCEFFDSATHPLGQLQLR